MKPLALTFDIGTQSLRGTLVDTQGHIIDKVQVKFETPYFSLNPGWAEQKGEFYWDHLCDVSKRLKEKSGDLWDRIKVVNITTVRDTVICLDKNGAPVRPAILWLDKREVDFRRPIPLKSAVLFRLSGMTETVNFVRKASPCNWIMTHEPENWEKTDKFVLLSAYMHRKFCGKIIDSTANVVGHLPYDNKNARWLKKGDLNHCIFPVEKEKLCKLVKPGEIMGHITSECAEETGILEGLPLVATGSDKGCETIGLSCTTPEKAAISFGTTATVQYTIDRYVEPQRFFPSYVSAYKNHYNPEIEIYRGYWLISWFKKEFAAKEVKEAERLGLIAEDLLNKRLSEIPPGCNGLVFQPYFTPGVAMPSAKGAVIGFSDVHTRIHIYRAIIEGINFALMDGIRNLEKRMKVKTKGIYVAGGGSRSSEICQITADMFGLPVYRSQTHEAAVIGSSIIAFLGIGVFKDMDEAIDSMVQIKDTFMPNREHHKIYVEIYENVFSKIFDKLKPLYKFMKGMYNN